LCVGQALIGGKPVQTRGFFFALGQPGETVLIKVAESSFGMCLSLTDSEIEKTLRFVIVLRQTAAAVEVKHRELVLGGRYPLIRRELIKSSGLLVAFR
jgi:hypothetical protein